MPARSLIAVTLVAVLVAAVLGGLGWSLAERVAAATASSIGLERLLFTAPGDLTPYAAKLAVALGLVPVLAWVVTVVRHRRARTPASLTTLFVHLAALAAAAAVGAGLRLASMRAALASVRSGSAVEPLVSVRELSLAGWSLGWAVLAALGLGVFALVKGAGERAARESSG